MATQHVLITLFFISALSYFGCSKKPSHEEKNVTNPIEKTAFGHTADGRPIDQFTLTNSQGMRVKIINFGGIITALETPDRKGLMGDVVLGFDSLQDYLVKQTHFGPIIGRYSGFIAKGKISIDGQEYQLETNAGPNHLHGGQDGFDAVLWDPEIVSLESGRQALQLSFVSPDGMGRFPGTLSTTITYTLSDNNELGIEYKATTDKKTYVNLTQHCYFNLSGGKASNVLNHEVTLFANQYAVVDETMIPTGELKDVKGTPADFTTPRAIGANIDQLPNGYDHNFPVKGSDPANPTLVGRVYEPLSGRVMELFTSRTGFEFASANWLNGSAIGKGGVHYTKQYGFLLYPQSLPDSPNHPDFPSTLLKPGETYHEITVYKFSAE